MTKKELKEATTQYLIELLVSNEGSIISRNGIRCNKFFKEQNQIAKELSERGLIDFSSFIKNCDYEI